LRIFGQQFIKSWRNGDWKVIYEYFKTRSLEDQLHSLNKRLIILEKGKEDELKKLKKLREQMESFLESRDA